MNKIYVIRNQKVMLDRDLAELYLVETRVLNQQVQRNLKRFPEDFMFQLTQVEFESLISQFVISNRRGGTRKPPFVFTEQGVAMLSGILNSDRAIAVNIQIMRIFTRVRQMLTDNTELRLDIEKIKKKLDNQDKNMEIVFRYLDELLEKKENPKPRTKIGYKMPGKK
ncbi:MAG: ORF6N domain-containing protein [Bacteroidota bacterium]